MNQDAVNNSCVSECGILFLRASYFRWEFYWETLSCLLSKHLRNISFRQSNNDLPQKHQFSKQACPKTSTKHLLHNPIARIVQLPTKRTNKLNSHTFQYEEYKWPPNSKIYYLFLNNYIKYPYQ